MTTPNEPQYRRKEDVDNAINMAVMAKDIVYVKLKIDTIEKLVEDKYITREEFRPVRMIVYGMVGTILTSVLGALLYLVIKKGGG